MGHHLPGRIVFMGTPAFAAVSLSALISSGGRPVAVFTNPDRRAGRGRSFKPSPVKAVALKEGIVIYQPENFKTPELIEDLKALKPDVIAVVAYGHILPSSVLDIPRLGCVNVHASVLPRHRGASPITHSILAGDRTTGVTTMKMDQGMDTGPIYMKREIPMPEGETTESLTELLAPLGGDLLVATLKGLESEILDAEPQDESRATLAPKIKSTDGLIAFDRKAEFIERQVRAFYPWPGSYFYIGEEKIKVLEAEVSSDSSLKLAEGEISTDGGFFIGCQNGSILSLQKVQRQGRKVMESKDFLRGFNVEPGTFAKGLTDP